VAHINYDKRVTSSTATMNGGITKSERKNLSSLSKAGLLLNKQLKKENDKMHLNSTTNGVVHDFTLEHVDFINQAACLLDEFEKINEEAFLPVIKVLFDWLRINPDILKTSGKVCFLHFSIVIVRCSSMPFANLVRTIIIYPK